MSISATGLTAPKLPPSPSNSYRAERAAIATLGLVAVWRGVEGVVRDFRERRTLIGIAKTILKTPHYIGDAELVPSEDSTSPDRELTMMDGVCWKFYRETEEILLPGTEIHQVRENGPVIRGADYSQWVSVVAHIGEVVLGVVAVNAAFK